MSVLAPSRDRVSYDIIGDVHGHASQLERLLEKLDYQKKLGVWEHSNRKAIFVGDLIDRGPEQLATLELVKAMVDAGSARVVMGNHEFNAIGWHTPDKARPSLFLRRHDGPEGEKHRQQHAGFLAEVGEGSSLHDKWIAWFRRLPLWIQEANIQVVHACWSPLHMDRLRAHLSGDLCLTDDLIDRGSREGNEIYDAIETILKGVEVELPPGFSFHDKGGHERHAIRTKWWDPALTTFRAACIGPGDNDGMPDIPLPEGSRISQPDRPTFIGHYWFDPKETPAPASALVACVDYSVANKGPLVAYRFDGELVLTAKNFLSSSP